MGIVAIILEVMLGLFFLLSGLLAFRLHETGWHETFLTAARPFADGGTLLTAHKLREKCPGVTLQGSPTTIEEYSSQLPWQRNQTPISRSSPDRKEMMMYTYLDAKEQGGMPVQTEVIATDQERLTASGFSSEEIVSLLWLQQWYQKGGSDRVTVLRHWEFLKLLVLTGKLDL
ncbi:MAG TPA: hypothetical protein VF043_03595 [Ktedonobacteraceae bacterium]